MSAQLHYQMRLIRLVLLTNDRVSFSSSESVFRNNQIQTRPSKYGTKNPRNHGLPCVKTVTINMDEVSRRPRLLVVSVRESRGNCSFYFILKSTPRSRN